MAWQNGWPRLTQTRPLVAWRQSRRCPGPRLSLAPWRWLGLARRAGTKSKGRTPARHRPTCPCERVGDVRLGRIVGDGGQAGRDAEAHAWKAASLFIGTSQASAWHWLNWKLTMLVLSILGVRGDAEGLAPSLLRVNTSWNLSGALVVTVHRLVTPSFSAIRAWVLSSWTMAA